MSGDFWRCLEMSGDVWSQGFGFGDYSIDCTTNHLSGSIRFAAGRTLWLDPDNDKGFTIFFLKYTIKIRCIFNIL